MRRAALGLTIGLLSCSAAYAQQPTPAPERTVIFDVAGQPMLDALNQFATQAGLRIVFQSRAAAGLTSPRLAGPYTPAEGLRKILAGTDLQYRFRDARTVEIRSAADDTLKKAEPEETSSSHPTTSLESPPGNHADRVESVEQITITGSRLSGNTQGGAQDTRVYTRDYIDRSGQNTVADFLNTLPTASVAATNETSFQTYGGMTTVNLRGLPSGTTLVLLNGRRVQTSGPTALYGSDFFDLNNIPLAAVDRIEVVSSGSSAIYGADAIAGVVNVVLKKSFSGFEGSVKHGTADGLDETSANLAFGFEHERMSASIVGSYQKRGELNNTERALSASNDYTAFGGPNNNGLVCPLANVFSTNGQPLPGAPAGSTATFAAVSGSATTGKPALTAFNYGSLNRCSGVLGSSLIQAAERGGMLLQGQYKARGFDLFAEILYSDSRNEQQGGYANFFGTESSQTYTVAAQNPYNPFGVTVGIARLETGAPGGNDVRTRLFRPLVGARGALFSSWDWEIAAWQTEDRTSVTSSNTLLSDQIQARLDSPDPATALNPFVAGPSASNSVLDPLFSNEELKFFGRQRAVSGFLRGNAFDLPAGPLAVVLGAELNDSLLRPRYIRTFNRPPNTELSFDRRSYAAFIETRLPLLASDTESGRNEKLVLSAAGRYDHYDDFGGTTTPQFGVELRPVPSLLIRATHADAFKAPPLPALYNPQVIAPSVSVTDRRTGQRVSVQSISGGNPQLDPIRGDTQTAGLVWSSQSLPNLQLSATYWRIDEQDAIQPLSAQTIINNEASFPDRVVRDATGRITRVDRTNLNFGAIRVSGGDYSIGYEHSGALGTWAPSLNATQIYRYESSLVPGAPPVDGLSRAQDTNNWAPRWKGTAALSWSMRPLTASVGARYVGKYNDYNSTRTLGDFWLFDANVRHELGQLLSADSFWKGAYIEVGGVNLFDKQPQYSAYFFNFVGYDAAQADIRGRFVYALFGVKL